MVRAYACCRVLRWSLARLAGSIARTGRWLVTSGGAAGDSALHANDESTPGCFLSNPHDSWRGVPTRPASVSLTFEGVSQRSQRA